MVYLFSAEHSQQILHLYPRSKQTKYHLHNTCLSQHCSHLATALCSHSQIPINIEPLIRLDFHPPHPLARHNPIFNSRFELITPWTPPAIPITIVIATQKLALGFRASFYRQGDIDRFEEFFTERGGEGGEEVDIVCCIFGVESTEEVASWCQLFQ